MVNRKIISLAAVALAAALAGGCATEPASHKSGADKMPFSGPTSVAFAKQLWRELETARLVGPARVHTQPYAGQHPHGAFLTLLESAVTVSGHAAPVLVKSNFGGPGSSIKAVSQDPAKFLKSVTVMYRREGYDPDNGNWFWAKYLPDGTLAKNPKGMKLAGRVAKGAKVGCIACHKAAPGGDMVFTHDRFAK